ncbi:MAG: PP2C family serine/threonine-protein phosphatase, partial [Dermabacter sp.]|nr:PP2C family serine/threonine-protein phosphatase [Dermabacter sp.]
MTIALRYAAKTDVGLVRSNNQDSGYAGSHLLVVADGMGGHAGGDVASSVAVGTLAELETDAPGTDIVAALEGAVLDANDAILRRAREEPLLAGLGTTVTALLRAGNKFALVHIGDSRAYLVREGTCTQVTKDHTFVQRLIDEGRLTPEEAERHPQRSMIMRVLGDVDADPELDLSLKPAVPGDRWMLCSDGLSGLVSFETISDVLSSIDDPDECAEHLVELALKAGGPDNITCVIADVIDIDDLHKG